MAATNPLEDERGVDRGQIRDMLALTPAERVERMVATANMFEDMLAHVREGRARR